MVFVRNARSKELEHISEFVLMPDVHSGSQTDPKSIQKDIRKQLGS